MTLRVGVVDYNNKSLIVQDAVSTLGHKLVRPWNLDCDVLFADTEVWWAPPHPFKRRLLEEAARRRVPIILYPHGNLAHIMYDGVWKPDLPVYAHLINGPGHRDVLEKFGYPRRLVEVGWTYSPVLPFQKPENVTRVLLGTIHAMGNGQILDYDHDYNVRTVQAVAGLDVPERRIRYVGGRFASGLDPEPTGVELVEGSHDMSYGDIDWADVVVGSGTFGWTAVARGKPTVLVGCDQPLRDTNGESFQQPDHWDELAPMFRYPVDFDDGPLPDLIQKALVEPAVWKDRFIGGAFDTGKFGSLLDELTPRFRPRPKNRKRKKK